MTTYQKLESQPDTSSDPAIHEDPTYANPEKPSPNDQEVIIGQVVSLPSQPPSHPFAAGTGPQAITGHTSATSYQYPINSGAPQYPVNPRYYELANFQTANQGQPPAYDPEIGLNNQTSPSSSQLLSYHEIHRAGNPACWRPFVGLFALGCGVSVVGAIVVAILFGFICGLANRDFDPEAELNPLTPAMLAFLNLVLMCGIPVSCFLSKQFHGIPYGWLASVQGRIRWSWFKICLGLSFIVLLATFLVSVILEALTSSELDTTGTDEIHVNEWTETTTGFIMVILLLTPFQAAAEEYAFRGYLTQAFGGIFSKWAAVLIPSFLFALAHGLDQTGPIFLDRFAFGFVSGLLVVKTGGLEAGIAMHILNNIYAFFFALMFGDITAAMEPTSDNWWGILVTMTQSVGYFVLTVKVAKRRNIQTNVSKGEVEGQRNQVNGFYSVPL